MKSWLWNYKSLLYLKAAETPAPGRVPPIRPGECTAAVHCIIMVQNQTGKYAKANQTLDH